MDSTKHVSSETSSDENDINAGTGRSYDCTFCRRGFTNAQALGGHMNLHRKDKAKAKHPTEDHDKACKYNFAPISSTLGAQMNYQTYFPLSNPSYPLAYHDYPSHFTANPEFSSVHLQDHKDENLSLRIGLPHVEDSEEKEKDGECNRKVNEVDLELRLGHNQGSK